MVQSEQADFEDHPQLIAEWVFHPLLLCLRIFGIPLIQCRWRRLNWLVGFLFLIANALVNISRGMAIFSGEAATRSTATSTVWCITAFLFCDALLWQVGNQVDLLFLCFSSWEKLWQVLQKATAMVGLDRATYRNFRWFSMIGMAVFLLEGTASAIKEFPSWSDCCPFLATLIQVTGSIRHIYPLLIMNLYLSVALFTWKLLCSFQQDIQKCLTNETISPSRLAYWKRTFTAISQLIDKINNCFGLFLLMAVTCIFITIIMVSFYIVFILKRTFVLDVKLSIDIMRCTVYLFLIAYIPRRIQREVSNVAIKLRLIRVLNQDLQLQINYLAACISDYDPKITAMGFLEINLELIPKLIGATVTFIIVLCQFQTAEEETS